MANTTPDETIVAGKDRAGKDTAKDVAKKVYEIGYVLLSSIAKEKVAGETAFINDVLDKAGAKVIAHEDPELTPLAYTMTKKIHGANQRFDEGYFGWVKFELSADVIASVKKALDIQESILRYLLMTTVKESTYLGKRAPAYTAGPVARDAGMIAPEAVAATVATTDIPVGSASVGASAEDVSVVPPVGAASVDEIDKSIEAMVKGV